MVSREKIVQDVLALKPPQDRAFVVEQLEQSLDTGEFAFENYAAWTQEIGRRVAAYERGEICAEDSDVVLWRQNVFFGEHGRKAES